MVLTEEQINYYLRNKRLAEQIILQRAGKEGHIIYGARALNVQLPVHLEKHTSDYDIYAKTPLATAKKTATELNKAFGGKYFYVKPAEHKGTYKVKAKFGKETVADYTELTKEIPTINKYGIKYAKLEQVKKDLKRMIRTPESKFRRPKDKTTLARIKAFERKWEGKIW